MTKKDLIKEILTLGKELEKTTGFDALMIIDEMERAVEHYDKKEKGKPVEVESNEPLIVEVKKDTLVELYNFAFVLAEDAGVIDELKDIDARLNSNL